MLSNAIAIMTNASWNAHHLDFYDAINGKYVGFFTDRGGSAAQTISNDYYTLTWIRNSTATFVPKKLLTVETKVVIDNSTTVNTTTQTLTAGTSYIFGAANDIGTPNGQSAICVFYAN